LYGTRKQILSTAKKTELKKGNWFQVISTVDSSLSPGKVATRALLFGSIIAGLSYY